MHKNLMIVGLSLLFIVSGVVYAQDEGWQADEDGVEYNCAMMSLFIDAIADEDVDVISEFLAEDFIYNDDIVYDVKEYLGIRTTQLLLTGDDVTLDTIFVIANDICGVEDDTGDEEENISNDTDTFNVIVNGNVNVRSCAATDCDILGQATNGSVLTVLGEEDDWYEFDFEGETAFIASWLTERGPDVYIEDLSEAYLDERTGCRIATNASRGDMKIQFILFGDSRSNIFVDLYRPNDENPLDVEGQLNKTFSDTNEPYIQQYYSWGLYWYEGVHEMELTFDGETSRIAWNVDTQSDILVYITCD